jgi:hypothetical protein
MGKYSEQPTEDATPVLSYDGMRWYGQAFRRGINNPGEGIGNPVLVGRPGCGKTTVVREAAGPDHLYITGAPTPFEVYESIYDFVVTQQKRGAIILDDTYSLLKMDGGVELVAHLMLDKRDRPVTWLRTSLPKPRRAFTMSNPVWLILNCWAIYHAHQAAISNRGTLLSFFPNAASVHSYVGSWFIVDELADDLYTLMGKLVPIIENAAKPNIRTFYEEPLRQMRIEYAHGMNPDGDWQKRIIRQALRGKGEKCIDAAALWFNTTYSSNNKRVQSWEEQGLGKRSQFYEHIKALKLLTDMELADLREVCGMVAQAAPLRPATPKRAAATPAADDPHPPCPACGMVGAQPCLGCGHTCASDSAGQGAGVQSPEKSEVRALQPGQAAVSDRCVERRP